MSTPYFQLLAHAYLATSTADRDSAVESALVGEGFGANKLAEGRELSSTGLELLNRRAREVVDERITLHGVHASAEEVDMWMQTVEYRLRRTNLEDEVLARTLGHDLHLDNHDIETVARALRMLGMVRTSASIHEELGTGRSVRDLLIRGNTLLDKLVDTGEKWISPSHAGDPDASIFGDFAASRLALTGWLEELDVIVDRLEDRPEVLGKIGYVPDDVGLPMGGSGYSITLHERSERVPPEPEDDPKGDPSWTIGRQGRNNENMGKGWVNPSVE